MTDLAYIIRDVKVKCRLSLIGTYKSLNDLITRLMEWRDDVSKNCLFKCTFMFLYSKGKG